jgi:hypothetical protein
LKELKAKKRQEIKILSKMIVDKITSSSDLAEVTQVWRDGISKNNVAYKISNSSSAGFKELSNRLLDIKLQILLRSEIIAMLLLSRDRNGEIVYNNGQISYIDNFKKFKKPFLLQKSVDEWQKIEEKIETREMHDYREKENRHGHNNNNKSYYGLGYSSLMNYFKGGGDGEDRCAEYVNTHANCCDAYDVKNAYEELMLEESNVHGQKS